MKRNNKCYRKREDKWLGERELPAELVIGTLLQDRKVITSKELQSARLSLMSAGILSDVSVTAMRAVSRQNPQIQVRIANGEYAIRLMDRKCALCTSRHLEIAYEGIFGKHESTRIKGLVLGGRKRQLKDAVMGGRSAK